MIVVQSSQVQRDLDELVRQRAQIEDDRLRCETALAQRQQVWLAS